jgi:hypothetical protein
MKRKKPLGKPVMDWIQLAYNKNQWRDLVNTAMNILFP